ncbi:hypothetical protein [Bradyrhizobium sp. CCBAU 21360]|uniref:hypothetical protein n=1 Tax=Bradyrhizobium sp. CCBAU 21360 TaxID=1325081 RepID=UPI003FA49805
MRKDKTPTGLRDHAILQLLATYGLRSSEICNLRLDDITGGRNRSAFGTPRPMPVPSCP